MPPTRSAMPPLPSTATPSSVAHPTPSRDPGPSKVCENNAITRFIGWAGKNSIAVTGWLVAFASMIVAIVSLLPSFRGQRLSEKALELAEWTALKDYIEQCKQELEAGVTSPECEEASTMSLPPPPHVNTHSINHIKRLIALETSNISVEAFDFGESSDLTPAMMMLVVFLTLLLVAVFLFASFESNRKYLYLSESVAIALDLALQVQDHPESTLGVPTSTDTKLVHPFIKFNSSHYIQSIVFSHPFDRWSAEEIRLADYNKSFRYGIQQDNNALPAAQLDEPQGQDSNAPQTLKMKDGFLFNHTARSSGIDSSRADTLLQRKRPEAASDARPPEQTPWVKKAGDADKKVPKTLLFACPYFKRNPIKYSVCMFNGQRSTRHIKTHLLRTHATPLYCPRCFEIFAMSRDLDDHIRAGCEGPVAQTENPFLDKIDEDTRVLLNDIPRSLTEIERWNHIYRTVFPGHTPPSPFRDGREDAKIILKSYRGQMGTNQGDKMEVDTAPDQARGESRFLPEIDVENILAEIFT